MYVRIATNPVIADSCPAIILTIDASWPMWPFGVKFVDISMMI